MPAYLKDRSDLKNPGVGKASGLRSGSAKSGSADQSSTIEPNKKDDAAKTVIVTPGKDKAPTGDQQDGTVGQNSARMLKMATRSSGDTAGDQDTQMLRLESLPYPEKGAVSLGRQSLDIQTEAERFDAPRKLNVGHFPVETQGNESKKAVMPIPDYRKAYADAANEAYNLYSNLTEAAGTLARDAKAANARLTRVHQSSLNQELMQLGLDLGRQRTTLAIARQSVFDRLHSEVKRIRSGIARAEAKALGKLSAKYADFIVLRSKPELSAAGIRKKAGKYSSDFRTAKDGAAESLGKLKAKPEKYVPFKSDAVDNAKNEAIRDFMPDYADAALDAVNDIGGKLMEGLTASYACVPCSLDSHMASLDGHLESVKIKGPVAVNKTVDQARKSVRKLVRQYEMAIERAFHEAETALIEQHVTVRQQLIETARQQGESEREQIAAGAEAQAAQLDATAGAQSTALANVHDMFEGQEDGGEAQFGNMVVGASNKLADNLSELARKQPAETIAKNRSTQKAVDGRAQRFEKQQSELRKGSDGRALALIAQSRSQLEKQMNESLAQLAPLPDQVEKSCDSFLDPENKFAEAVKGVNEEVGNIGASVESAWSGANQQSDGDGKDGKKQKADSRSEKAKDAEGKSDKGKTAAKKPDSCAECPPKEKKEKSSPAKGGQKKSGGDTNANEAGKGASDGDKGKSDKGSAPTPKSFTDTCLKIAKNPLEAPEIEPIFELAKPVRETLQKRAAEAASSFETWGAVDAPRLLKALENITKIQGNAIKQLYRRPYGLESDIRILIPRKGLSAGSTDKANVAAAISALNGDVESAAFSSLKAAFNYSNNDARISQVMKSLTPAQMASFNSKYGKQLDELQEQLSGKELEEFKLLREGQTDKLRAVDIKRELVKHNRFYGTKRGYESGKTLEKASIEGYGLHAEGDKTRVRADIFGLELASKKDARRQAHWEDTRIEFSNLKGVEKAAMPVVATVTAGGKTISPDDQKKAERQAKILQANATLKKFATRDYDPYARNRKPLKDTKGNVRPHFYTDTMQEHHGYWIDQILEHGGNSDQARGAHLFIKQAQKGRKATPKDLDAIVHTGEGDAKEGAGYDEKQRQKGGAEEQKRKQEIFKQYVRAKLIIDQKKTPKEAELALKDTKNVQQIVADDFAAYFGKQSKSKDLALSIFNTDESKKDQTGKHALNVIENAIATEDHEYALTQLKRMDRKQVKSLVEAYNANHPEGPGLQEKLGLFKHHWSLGNMNGAVFSGDEANSLEIAFMGVPQNPKERGEVALRVMDQTTEQSSWLGRALAGGEYDRLVANANRLRGAMGVNKGDIDDNGEIRANDPLLGKKIGFGHFDKEGNFTLPEGSQRDAFESAVALARISSDDYTQATDRIATFVATALVVVAAIVTTVLTGGAAASIWIPMLVTAGAGLVGVGLTAAIKGGRYSRDQVTRDLAMVVVQTVTAGVGAAAGVAMRGGSSALSMTAKSLSVSEKALGSLPKLSFVKELGLGALTGGLGGVGGALADPVAWRKGKVGENVVEGLVKGVGGGMIGAAAMRPVAGLMSSTSLSTQAMGRSLGSGLGGAGSKAFELGVDSVTGKYKGSFGDAVGEIGLAGAQGMIQGIGEAYGERLGDRGGLLGKGIAARSRGKADKFLEGPDHPLARGASGDYGEDGASALPRPANDNADPDGQVQTRRPDPDMDSTTGEPRFDKSSRVADDSRPITQAAGSEEPLKLRSVGGESSSERTTAELPAYKPTTLADHVATPDGPKQPIFDSVNITPDMLKNARSIPEYSEFRGTNPKDPDTALGNYRALKDNDPHREVLLAHNPATGEYKVIQGGEHSVSKPGEGWITKRHSHPRLAGGETAEALVRSMPSATGGDFAVLKSEFDHLSAKGLINTDKPLVSVIDTNINGVKGETHFSIGKKGDQYELKVSFRPPNEGVTELGPFKNIGEYEAKAFELTKVDFAHPGSDAVRSNEPQSPSRQSAHLEPLAPNQRSDLNKIRDILIQSGGEPMVQRILDLQRTGIFDPALRPTADMELAHAMVRELGLVGEPDSMIKLSRILSDRGSFGDKTPGTLTADQKKQQNLWSETKALIADATLSATREQLQKDGKLDANEPLFMLFHGAPDTQLASYVEHGINLGMTKGSPGGDDVGLALYASFDPQSAELYTQGSGPVLPAIASRADLHGVLDIRSGAALHADWQNHVRANLDTYSEATLRPGIDIAAALRAGGDPLDLYFYRKAGRQEVFENFLDSISPGQKRPDMVVANLGDAVTNGNIRLDETGAPILSNQIGIRVDSDRGQAIADLFNRQHGFGPESGSARAYGNADDTGGQLRTVTTKKAANDNDPQAVGKSKTPEKRDAPVIKTAQPSTGRRVGIFDQAFKLLVGRNSKHAITLEGVMKRTALKVPQEKLARYLMESDAAAKVKIHGEIVETLKTSGSDPTDIERTLFAVSTMDKWIGKKLQALADDLVAAPQRQKDLPPLSETGAKIVAESDIARYIATEHPELFKTLEDSFTRSEKREISGSRFEEFLSNSLPQRARNRESTHSEALESVIKYKQKAEGRIVDFRHALAAAFVEARAKGIRGTDISASEPATPINRDFADLDPLPPDAVIAEGARVDHPEHGRGTVTGSDETALKVRFDRDGSETISSVDRADGKIYAAVDPTTRKPLEQVPFRSPEDKADAKAEIAAFREKHLLPNFPDKGAGTVSIAKAGKHQAEGVNATLAPSLVTLSPQDRRDLKKLMHDLNLNPDTIDKDGRYVHHAELASLISLRNKLKQNGEKMPEVVELFVDRDTCDSCKANLDLVAAYLGITELRIYTNGDGAKDQPLIRKNRR